MTKGLEKLEGLETGDTVTVKFVADGIRKINLDGIYPSQITEIVSVEKKPKPMVGYVNVYDDGMGGLWEEDRKANNLAVDERLALLKITANPATGEYSIEEVKE